MGATLTINETTSKMVRLVSGKLVVEDGQRNLYIVPPKGEYEWEITGYALPFEMKKSAQFIKPGESEYATKTRLEITITSGKGAGKMFTEMFGFSIGPRSTLGKLLRALNVSLEPDAVTRQWDLDRVIGYKGKSYVTHGQDATGAVKLDDQGKPKYTSIVIDTVEALGAPERPYSIDISDEDLTPQRAESAASSTSTDDGWPE
jgi:hypothetical protein